MIGLTSTRPVSFIVMRLLVNIMVGTLAQLIALASHADAYLREDYYLHSFYPANSTFRFCNEVSFVAVKKRFRLTETEMARTPNEWFRFLKDTHCNRVSLIYAPTLNPRLPDRISVAFVGGGGTWYIASNTPKYTDYWIGRWQVTNQDAPDKKIWKVTYGRVLAKGQIVKVPTDNLSLYKERIEAILKEIEAFALKHDLSGFAKCFHSGLDALVSSDPISLSYHIRPASRDRVQSGGQAVGRGLQ